MIILLLQKIIAIFAIDLLSQEQDVSTLALQYYHVRIWSAPATLMLYVFVGYFLAIAKARIVLAIMLVNQVGNMLLDYLLVMQYNLNVIGVAYGSVISEYLALILAFYFLFKGSYRLPKMVLFKQWLAKKSDFKAFFNLNRDIFIRTLCLMLVFAFMTKGSSRLGELTLAVNAVLLNFFYITTFALDGFAHAVESLCGQAYGARNKSGLLLVIKKVFIISFIIALFFSLLYLFFGKNIVNLLTSIQEVREYAFHYIIWLVIIPIIAMVSFVYDGLFVATTQGKIMRNSMLIATVFCYVPLWYSSRTYENHG